MYPVLKLEICPVACKRKQIIFKRKKKKPKTKVLLVSLFHPLQNWRNAKQEQLIFQVFARNSTEKKRNEEILLDPKVTKQETSNIRSNQTKRIARGEAITVKTFRPKTWVIKQMSSEYHQNALPSPNIPCKDALKKSKEDKATAVCKLWRDENVVKLGSGFLCSGKRTIDEDFWIKPLKWKPQEEQDPVCAAQRCSPEPGAEAGR
uniref:Uncharacterized protein LOC123614334 n=1 Tax=Camelus bactrianus TaxID=9837 RepID=A0A9W3FSD8_CAMBA|nr:uncharacterized protein LOC123614334 [Camelus bactrianus]